MTDLSQVDIEQGKVNVEVFNQTDAALSVLTEKYSSIPDVTTQDGYEFVKAGVKVLTGYRTNLDAERKRIKQPYLEAGRIIDAEAKRITEKLVVLEDPMKVQKKEIDDKKKLQEEQRLTQLAEKVQEIYALTTMARNQPSASIAKMIDELDAIDTRRDYYDLTRDAIKAKEDVLQQLSEMYGQQLKYEQAQIEQEWFRKEQEVQQEARRISDKVNKMRMIPADLMGSPSSEIEGNLKNLKNYDIPRDEFGDQYNDGQAARQKAMEQLTSMLQQQRMVEEAQAAIQRQANIDAEEAKAAIVPEQPKTMEFPAAQVPAFVNVDLPEVPKVPADEDPHLWLAVKEEPDAPDELSGWCEKWGVSRQARNELNDILTRHL